MAKKKNPVIVNTPVRRSVADSVNRTADDAYYRSSSRSAISSHNVANRKGRINGPMKAVPPLPMVPDDTNTDKYYKDGGSPMQQRMAGKPFTVPVHSSTDSTARPSPGGAYAGGENDGVVRPLIVTRDNVLPAVQTMMGLLKSGQGAVLIQVETAAIENDMRVQMDLAIARELLTQAQSDRVRFSLTPGSNKEIVDKVFGELTPEVVPPAESDEKLPVDFSAFVKAGKEPDRMEPEKLDIFATPEVDEDDENA